MRMKAFMGLALVLAAGATQSACAAGGVIYDSNGFEPTRFTTGSLTGADGGIWIESGGPGGTALIESAVKLNGAQAVQLNRTSDFTGGGDKRYWPDIPTPTLTAPVVVVKWDMNVTANTTAGVATGPFFGIDAYAPGFNQIAGAGVDSTTGEVLFEDPAFNGGFNNTTNDVKVTLGAWHHYELLIDFSRQVTTVTVDGTPVQTVTGFLTPSATQFQDADLAALATDVEPPSQLGTAYFDNYSVINTTVPEPTAILTVGSAMALAFPRRPRRTS